MFNKFMILIIVNILNRTNAGHLAVGRLITTGPYTFTKTPSIVGTALQPIHYQQSHLATTRSIAIPYQRPYTLISNSPKIIRTVGAVTSIPIIYSTKPNVLPIIERHHHHHHHQRHTETISSATYNGVVPYSIYQNGQHINPYFNEIVTPAAAAAALDNDDAIIVDAATTTENIPYNHDSNNGFITTRLSPAPISDQYLPVSDYTKTYVRPAVYHI